MGAIGAGRVADRIGRQRTILITAALFMTGVLAARSRLLSFSCWPRKW
jgi:MFS family permease